MGKSTIIHYKSPFLIGKSSFFMGKSTISILPEGTLVLPGVTRNHPPHTSLGHPHGRHHGGFDFRRRRGHPVPFRCSTATAAAQEAFSGKAMAIPKTWGITCCKESVWRNEGVWDLFLDLWGIHDYNMNMILLSQRNKWVPGIWMLSKIKYMVWKNGIQPAKQTNKWQFTSKTWHTSEVMRT